MQIEIYADEESAGRAAAKTIAAEARIAVGSRDRFVMAVSGGRDFSERGVPLGPRSIVLLFRQKRSVLP
jgi:hypothetical protein